LPLATRSAHWLVHLQFKRAIVDSQREADAMAEYMDELNERRPFKHG